MNQPYIYNIDDDIYPAWFYVQWNGIYGASETGGDNPIYYGLEWDQGNGTWINTTDPSVGLIYAFNVTS